ncbi:MAG: hypothetical protein HY089_01675, partial [Ignavibacteriales bacterium]|nr:hypothetical protein [Ignavibacteriales bacterium]
LIMNPTTNKKITKPDTKPEKDLLKKALAVLEETTGITAHVLEWEPGTLDGQLDATVEFKKDKVKAEFTVEIKRTLHEAALAHLILKMQNVNHPMIVAYYITPPMAERLKKRNMAFIDTTGNAYLNLPGLFVYITGRKPPRIEKEAEKIKAFRPTGLKVIFALLCMPEMVQAPYREIAKAANVALGTVDFVLNDLKRLNYLVERGDLARKLVNIRALLDIWVTAYGQQLRPKIYIGRFRGPNADWWKKLDWIRTNAYLGGEPAADKLTQYLKAEKVTLYVRGETEDFLFKNRLHKDLNGDVEIFEVFWDFDYTWQYPNLVPPLLIYAELLAAGNDRNIETGKIIYEKYLAQLVRQN